MADTAHIDKFVELYGFCRHYTMTSRSRMFAVYEAVRTIVSVGIPGDVAECGVWRGGSMMMAAMALVYFGDTSRRLYLYDTFEGMTEPSAIDYDLYERPATKQHYPGWCAATLQEVIENMTKTGYPQSNIVYVTGKVEETIPETMPERIALLRLDTDWYQSTAHELKHLYPLVSQKGFLIIDDYGHWKGAKLAVDEYFGNIDMIEIDYTGRMIVK